MSRTEKKKARNHKALLEAGKRIFAEKGYQNTTIRDITDSCDMGYGTFYLYFSGKESLLQAAVEEFIQDFVAYKSVRTIRHLSIRDRMYFGTRDMLEFVYENKDFLKAVCSISPNDESGKKIVDEIWQAIYKRMFDDHSYFEKKGYAKENISLDSKSWMIYTWTLQGIINGIVLNDVQIEEIDELSRIYADMNYYTFIKEDIQRQNL